MQQKVDRKPGFALVCPSTFTKEEGIFPVTQNDRRELATLISMVLKHPAMAPDLKDEIHDLFSRVHPQVDAYSTPEGIELYLDAWDRTAALRRQKAAA